MINQYFTTYQALQFFCSVEKRWSLTLANIYYSVDIPHNFWDWEIDQQPAWHHATGDTGNTAIY